MSVHTSRVQRRQCGGSRSEHTIEVPGEVLRALRPYAAMRGTRAQDLARMILERVAEDGLVDAILDDED